MDWTLRSDRWLSSDRIAGTTAVLLSFVGGVAASRILFEGLFPRALWLGRPLPVLLVATLVAVLGWLLWRWLSGRTWVWNATAAFMPLSISLAFLLDSAVNPTGSRFLFFVGLWLMALLLAGVLARPAGWPWLGSVILISLLLPVYLLTMGRSVGTADSFEFQVVVPGLGIVHPTGYPLYLLLTRLFIFIPFNSVAWRVNLATAIYGLLAVCLLYLLLRRLTGWNLPAIVAAALFGLTPTFWGEAVEAEVYTLHALVVAAALFLMREIGDWRLVAKIYAPETGGHEQDNRGAAPDKSPETANSAASAFLPTLFLAFVLGLGLTNHLTTVILIPAAILAVFLANRAGRYEGLAASRFRSLLLLAAAFLLPLILYAYLPLRWSAVNGEPMGINRFVEWVIGGRFQGALQLSAWLNDATRYDIVGRLFVNDWPSFWTLLLIVVGVVNLLLWQWRYGLIVLVVWLGYVFYALNYYVPDLAVFIIPAQLIMAIWWLGGVVAALDLLLPRPRPGHAPLVVTLCLLAGAVPLLVTAADETWAVVDRSLDDRRAMWGRAVLEQPLALNAAILADSDKFPPLYYLQQAEGLRPDLDIMVLPDEAAYRTELDARISTGQTVYLARFLPGLESIYHLRSEGPLVEVSPESLTALPPGAIPSDLNFGAVQLKGYRIESPSPYAEAETAVTLYWQATEPLEEILHVYTRWVQGEDGGPSAGQHPANNTYPTVAWAPGEVVADFHGLPLPVLDEPSSVELQVALAPPFTPSESLAWNTVTGATLEGPDRLSQPQPVRMQLGSILLDGVDVPSQVRPQDELSIGISGYGTDPDRLLLTLQPAGTRMAAEGPGQATSAHDSQSNTRSFVWSGEVDTDLPAGRYQAVASAPGSPAICGWLARRAAGCVLGEVAISGAPLPDGATNFEDRIALLSIEVPEMELRRGGQLSVSLTWQALAEMEQDYTVFVQVLDADDRIVGQVDSWPVQGTHPTSQWRPGEVVEDLYLVPLAADLPPGPYKLQVGWYLLETLRRLPVLDKNGVAFDDKVLVPGLVVPAS